MRTFDVFSHSEKNDEAAKRGFSWPGFFFGVIWAFVKGLPGVGLLLIIVMTGLHVLEGLAEMERSPELMLAVALLYIVVPLVVGFNGNGWRRSKLIKQGYVLSYTTEADNPAAAITTSPYTEKDRR